MRSTQALVVHPRLDVLGGAEVVAVHMIDRLLALGAQVTLVSRRPLDFDAVRLATGVELDPARVNWYRPPPRPARCPPLLETALLHRWVRSVAGRFDLLVSTFNEQNFGRPGIQYVHCPLFADRALIARYQVAGEAPSSSPRRRAVYDRAVAYLADLAPEKLKRNRTLTNSGFMAGVIREAYGLESEVLYPAFLPDESPSPPPDRSGAPPRFFSIGRIARDKHTHALPDLFAAIHRRIPTGEFVVAGFVADPAYYREVRSRAEALGVPVTFRTDLARSDVERLYQGGGAFINPKPYEHFGISTAEALHAGCLPFVHASGGSVEIVPLAPLQFRDAAELAQKAERLLTDADLRQRSLTELAAHAEKFRASRFHARFAQVVEEVLRGHT